MKESGGRTGANSILRMVCVAISVVAQAVWLVVLNLRLNEYSRGIALLTNLLAVVVVLKLYSRHTTADMKMPWVMLILVFPVMGLTLYLLIRVCGDLGGTRRRLEQVRHAMPPADPAPIPPGMAWCRPLGCPVYGGTKTEYFPEAADAFEKLKRDLERAKKFVFMEYFIVEDGEAFREIEEILIRKAAQGVEVRLLYDDIGSGGVADARFASRLRNAGIRCRVFNPAVPFLNLFMNHRDHRKITVIDGETGYTGGFNLAGEYFGYTQPHGHWKDVGLRLEGLAVESLTRTFLELWGVTAGETGGMEQYLNARHEMPGDGWVLPFGDDPLGQERLTEDLYLNLISGAGKRLWFMTPYLIITGELTRALGLAAKRGVDVRIITPGIPDKKTVYAVTRSYYSSLARQGVRIFEYSPGFCHGKICVCDDETAVVGTSNLDFRSLYHHFENNVVLHQCSTVAQVAADLAHVFPQCREVTERYADRRRSVLRVWQCILRLFAPMM